jgi:hypothetical protein
MMSRVSPPGTIAPRNQRIQLRSTWAIFNANSAITALAAMPVRNMAEAV